MGDNSSVEQLLARRLVFVTGKGGVGKTVVSGALGWRAAASRKRVLLCEVAAQSAFGRIFGRRVDSAPEVVAPGLWAVNLDASRCLVDFLTRFVRIERVARALVKNAVAQRFFDAAPGVLETVVLERVARFTQNADGHTAWDLVIVDLPATGHAITFLDVPRNLANLMQAGSLADTLRELSARLGERGFAELALVTQAEEMPVQETIELWRGAHERLATPLEVIFVNQVRRSGLSSDVGQRLRRARHNERAPAALRASRLAAVWDDREHRHLDRLGAELPARLVEIPWFPERSDDRDLIERVAGDWGPDA